MKFKYSKSENFGKLLMRKKRRIRNPVYLMKDSSKIVDFSEPPYLIYLRLLNIVLDLASLPNVSILISLGYNLAR